MERGACVDEKRVVLGVVEHDLVFLFVILYFADAYNLNNNNNNNKKNKNKISVIK